MSTPLSAQAGRQLFGLAIMACSCGLSFWIGGRTVRIAAVVCVVCWLCVFVLQWLSGLTAEPVIVGEMVGGVALLTLAAVFNQRWLWLEVALQALLFMLHAWLYGAGQPPSRAQIVGNNLLTTAMLAVLLVAAVRSAALRRLSSPCRERHPSERTFLP